MAGAVSGTRAGRRFTVMTPEHVPLEFAVGDLGARASALFVDVLAQWLVVFAVALAAGLLGLFRQAGENAVGAFLILGVFLVRNFYFTWFELRRGRTPGKRKMGLQVVARDGGPLTADLVFARNLTREIEVFLPLTILLAPDALVPDAPGWVTAATVLWVVALVLLPFTNRLHARLGDLVAGTVVVHRPEATLREDLAAAAQSSGAAVEYRFTERQLSVYGIHELEVLEDLLRRDESASRREAMAAVVRTIVRKIGWHGEPGRRIEPERFLRAFYAAQRRHLEGRLLLGERRERKSR